MAVLSRQTCDIAGRVTHRYAPNTHIVCALPTYLMRRLPVSGVLLLHLFMIACSACASISDFAWLLVGLCGCLLALCDVVMLITCYYGILIIRLLFTNVLLWLFCLYI